MAKYEIQDDGGRKVQIEIDGEVTPEIAEQAFASYDAIGITQAGPSGSEARRRAQAGVAARNAQDTVAEISGGSTAGPALSGIASAARAASDFGLNALTGLGRAASTYTDVVGGALAGNLRPEDVEASTILARSEENPLVKAGTSLRDQSQAFYPVNPKEKAANLVGSALGSIVGTVASGPLAVPAYALSSGEAGLQEALAAGATPDQAIQQAMFEAGTGAATEGVLGVVPGLREAKAGAMRGIVRPTLKSTVGEAVQEPLEGALNRASARYVTGSDPTAQPLDPETLAMEAAGGAIGGVAAGGAFAAANARDRGNRLRAIQEYRTPEATFLRQIENAPLGRPATSAPVGAVNVPDKASIDLSPLNLPQSETATQLPPLDPAQLDGMSSADILGVLQQRLDVRRAAFADRIARKSATEPRARLEAGLTIPQEQPIEALPEPAIGTYPEGGMGTGVILPAEEAARRAQVRQEVSARGQQRAAEGAAENLRRQEEEIWRQLNAEQAANEMASAQPQPPTQPAIQPARVDMRVPAILATLNQRQQEAEIWRQLHAELASNPISTPLIDARSNETRQNQVAPASPVLDVKSQPAVTQAEGQAPQGTPLQAGAGTQIAAQMTPEQRVNLANNIQRMGWNPESYGMTKAEVDSLATKIQPNAPAPAGFTGGTVVRYTLADGTGLMNRGAFDTSKLSDNQAQELTELLSLSLNQPLNVKYGDVFTFTPEGEKQHARLIALLKKAATGKVVRTEYTTQAAPTWQSADGQLAFNKGDLVAPTKPRQFQGREVIGDILDDIESQGGLVSKTEARKRKLLASDKNGPEYDDPPTLKQPLHNFIYGNGRGGKGSMTPDRMAKALEMQHPEKYAGLTVSDLWAAIESSSNSRVVTETKMRRMRESDVAEGKNEDRQQKSFNKATSKSKGGPEGVNVSDLVVGGEVTIDGESFKVADVDPENGDVVLQDGAKFGRRVVEADKVIYVENVTQPSADTSFNEPDSFSAPPEPTGVRLRKSPLRSEPAAAQSIATSGVGEAASPTASPAIEGSVFGVRPYRGAPTITKEVYNRINEAIDAGIAREDLVAQNIRDLDANAENDIKKSSGYEPLSDGGKFDAIQRYRNKLYQSAVKWADTGKFLFDPMVIAKGVTMDVGKSGTEKMAKQTAGEETAGESGTSTTLTRATTQVLPQTPIEADTTRVKQDAVEVLNQLRARLNLSASELVSIISAYQSDTTANLNDKELAAFNAVKPTLDKIGALNFSVSSLISEPIGKARAQEAVDNWMESVGNPPILIRVVDDPNLKTKNGRNVAAQIEFSQGGQPIITINGAQIGSEAEVREKIWHELLHTVWEDPTVQKAWAEVVAKITEADVQAQVARGYSPRETTMEAAIDKASIRAANTTIRPTWKRFLDSIWQALKKAFGFQTKPANFEALMISALRAAAGPWTGQQQSRYNKSALSGVWEIPNQAITSAATSINESKTPATFSKVTFAPGTRNADIGGGRFDNATDLLSKIGVENVIFDPFNRSRSENETAAGKISNGQSDTATVNNVLNVISDKANRDRVISQAADAIKEGGTAYFLIYEGDKTGTGRVTKSVNGAPGSWQENRGAGSYVTEIGNHFSEVSRSGNLITAKGPIKTAQESRYSQDVAAMDKPYMEAVARGDMAAARKMVDAAAKAAGYNVGPVFHGTSRSFNEFDKEKRGASGTAAASKAFWFTEDEATAGNFSKLRTGAGGGSRIINAYLKGDFAESDFSDVPDWNTSISHNKRRDAVQRAIRNGKDGVHFIQMADFGPAADAYAVFNPEQIKSADPVTYDNAGNVVLLSQRFNPESKDIRYSVANNMYVTQPERFKKIAEQGQTEAVVAQGQTASAIIPESTLKEIADLEAKPNPTPAEKAAITQLKAVRNIVGVAVVADQIRQTNEGNWPNYRTLDDLPEQYKSVAAQSVMATHLYLNQRYNNLKTRQERAASQIADITSKLDGLNESRLLALVSNNEADQLLKDLQTMIDLEIGKVGTSAASRTLDELHKASAAVVGLRQKQDAIAAALRSIAKDAPMADFASPEAMKSWVESRQADKSKPQLMTDEVATAIRASLKPGSGLPDRLSLIRALMADTAVAKTQIKDLKVKVGNPKTALKAIIALKMDASSVLNQVAKLDRSLAQQLVTLDGLDTAIGVMDRMQESKQYQARVTSAVEYDGFKYSGMIRYTNKPNGEQTLVGPSGKEYLVNFTPDFVVEKKNLDTIGAWMAETTNALYNESDPNTITDPAKRTSYLNQLAYVTRYMMDRRWLNESAWDDAVQPVDVVSAPLMAVEKAGTMKLVLGDHMETRYNAYRAIAGRAGDDLVRRSRAIDTFGAKAKTFTDSMKEPLATARRKAVESHGFNPDDAADLAVWNRKINSWILSQNQNPGSTPVKVGDSLGEGLLATKEDMAFAEMQHKFSRAIGEIYSGSDVEGGVKDPESPGLSPEEQLFGLDFSRKAMQYGYAVGRQFSEAGQEYTREWMAARAKDLSEYKNRVSRAAEGEEVPMVWTERSKVAEADIEGHVYSHIRESSTDYTSTADKQSREAYREIAKAIRRGTHYSTLNDISEALAPLLSTETEEGTVEVGASQAKESLLKALDKDVLNYNRVAELVTQPSNDPTVSDLPKALAAVRSAKGALVKARGKLAAPSFFYDYSLDTDAKRAGMVQMGKQALVISEINAMRNMSAAMRAKLAEYDAKIEQKAQQIGRNGKKLGTWKATRELEAELRKKFKAGELQVTYELLSRMANKLDTLTSDREESLNRQKIMEEEAFKVTVLNFAKGGIASVLLSAISPIVNNLTAVVLDPLRLGLMHGNIGLAFAMYAKQGKEFVRYAIGRTVYKLSKKLGLMMPRKVQAAITDLSASVFHDMLTFRQELEDAGIIESAEPFTATWNRYKANPLSFGDTTRAKETATSRAISGVLTSPILGARLVPVLFEYIRQRAPGSGDRAVNYLNAKAEKILSDKVKVSLWNWVNSLEGSTPTEKAASAASSTIKPEDLKMTKENLSNYRTTYGSTGSLERLAADFYLRNPDNAKGDLLTKAQRDSVVFDIISLTNKEVDSTRADFTKGGPGIAGAGRSTLYLFQRYVVQLFGSQKRAFGVKAGADWAKKLGQAMSYLFYIAMTLFTGVVALNFKQLARVYLQKEPLTGPTILQVAENPELVGKYLTAAAGGVMSQGATLVGALLSGQPLAPAISANMLDNNPVIGAANNVIGAAKSAYESGDLVYPALDFARKQVWFSQPLINTLMPGDAASREAKRAVRTGAVGMEVRESGGAPAQVKSTPMTPIVRDAVAAIYEKDDAKFQAAKQRGIDYLVGRGLSTKEAEKRFNASISGREPFRSVLGTNPTEEQVSTIIGRSSPGQRTTLRRAREGFSLRKKSKSKGLKLRSSSSRGRKASGLRRARKPARLRKSSLG